MRVLRASGTMLGALVTLSVAWGCATQNPAADLQDGKRAYREGRQPDAELIWLETLAEAFQQAGYWTAGVVGNRLLFRPAGYDQGFDEWVEVSAGRTDLPTSQLAAARGTPHQQRPRSGARRASGPPGLRLRTLPGRPRLQRAERDLRAVGRALRSRVRADLRSTQPLSCS